MSFCLLTFVHLTINRYSCLKTFISVLSNACYDLLKKEENAQSFPDSISNASVRLGRKAPQAILPVPSPRYSDSLAMQT